MQHDRRSKRQIRNMDGLREALNGAAIAFETAIENGFEPTFTSELAGEFVAQFQQSLARINESVQAIKKHANSL